MISLDPASSTSVGVLDDEGIKDHSLAHERTRMAWTRSAEDVAIVFLALSRHLRLQDALSLFILALMVLAFVIWISSGSVIRRRLRHGTSEHHGLYALMTVTAVMLATASVLISFVPS